MFGRCVWPTLSESRDERRQGERFCGPEKIGRDASTMARDEIAKSCLHPSGTIPFCVNQPDVPIFTL